MNKADNEPMNQCEGLAREKIVAGKRGISFNAHPVVYALTLTTPLRAIWGNGGSLEEWGLLLESGVACAHIQTHHGTIVDVVVANIGP